MNIISLLGHITSHPLNKNDKKKAVLRFIKWQLTTRLSPYPIIYPFTKKSKLIIQKGMTGATGNLYSGLHEFEDMAFTVHLLRENDDFVDIGANVGTYTVLAAAHVGANTICVEPVPSTYANLVANIAINQAQKKATSHNIALGSQKGTIKFTSSLDTMNHAVAKGEETDTIDVQVSTLDDLLADKNIPLLIKIDVEGFETEVINGASETLKSNNLKAIIMELNGSGSRYGYDENKVYDKLIGLNFKSFQYDPMERKLNLIDSFSSQNVIFIRDLDFVQQRLATADRINILNQSI